MRSWTIRSKLLAIPLLAAALCIATSLLLSGANRRYAARLAVVLANQAVPGPGARGDLAVANRELREALRERDIALANQALTRDRIAIGAFVASALLVTILAGLFLVRSVSERIARWRLELHHVRSAGAPPEADAALLDVDDLIEDPGKAELKKAMEAARIREMEQRRASEFLEFAQAAGGFGVFDLDLHTRNITGTALFFELTGLNHGDLTLTQDQWLATVHPADLEGFIEQLSAAMLEGGNYQAEYRSLLLGGGYRWLASRGRVVLEADGEPGHMIGTLSDITERKQLEEKLSRTSDSLNIAKAAAGVATFDINIATGECFASNNIHELLAIPPETELADLDAHLARVHPEDFERARSAPFDVPAGESLYRCEYRVLLEDDAVRWIAEKASVTRDRAGRIVRIAAALIDVTDLKQTQAALVEARLAAEAANRAKSSFLANVSHEIRTPMNAVIGMARFLGETQLAPEQREYVDVIHGSAGSLLALLNDVLDFSKIEADRLDLDDLEFGSRDLVYEAVAAVSLQSAAKGIEAVVDIAADVPFRLRGDPGRLRQIIVNLVGNAIKFTHEGWLLLSVRATPQAGGRALLRIEVTDTGIGIAQDRIDKLFKPFSQLDASTTRDYGGTGLGLSIVKRLAELMGGEVGVRSVPGEGSTFWATVSVAVMAGELPLPQSGRGRRVLLVDDVDASRISIETKLAIFGYDTVAVASVDAALAHLEDDAAFSLVLADELMPGRGGRELLEALRADPRLAHLPFVLLAFFGSKHSADGWSHRPDAVGQKPLRGANLASLLDGVLAGQSAAPASAEEAEPPTPAFQGARILLVDDNPVNQRIAQRLLQKLGARVTVASNGAEALAAFDAAASVAASTAASSPVGANADAAPGAAAAREAPFDLVLMDCQMPVMDGFTATRQIREREARAGGGARLPVIALTANVMSEDRDNCRAAGMDGHLGKPLDPALLAACLARHLSSRAAPPAIDRAALLVVTGGDAEFERELIETFIASGDEHLAAIVAALAQGDFVTIGRRAHALKGASANLHARPLAETAAHLEHAANGRATAGLDGLVRTLGAQLGQFRSQLA